MRNDVSKLSREQHLSQAQMFAICTKGDGEFYESLRIKREVFPFMRNDDISRTAIEDPLICFYAESLLRKHKRIQIKNVISNKMRELGRLLLIIRSATGTNTFFDAMKPEMFDHFVTATRVISGYDSETRTFKAGSLALHMGTSLKQVCDIATKLVIKKSNVLSYDNQESTLKEIKWLRNLIQNHWNSEISSLALKNLNEKRHEKPTFLPLTSDVIKFHKYVKEEANDAKNNLLRENKQKFEYKRLSECVLALTLLLNRKRIGEIQYLTVDRYNHSIPQTTQEEFLLTLSSVERKLTSAFKRVITPGKGSKPVPILFSKDMQNSIELLLRLRNLNISQENQYLFANPNTDTSALSGYHTIRKLAERSGVVDKTLFTSNRLRKQIATILQVLNITETEFEQIAKFMGHTKDTHASFYR
ncbi:uncharacterized protein LOC132698605 [Cylas formicarius]|uniref:uncharacterized protein LOC132698605 n=1 Tax=Cylas formicarius TaxID=197179 RepID=UPI0029584C12|nr:uncharacterized protein LOC132698605 [Cylas formicarius]